MKIVDILIDSASILGLTEETKILENSTTENENQIIQDYPKIASLFNLIKYSIRELCTNYIPLLKNEIIKTENKKYPLNQLENFIRIQNVSVGGELIKYKILSRNLVFCEDGEYVVSYLSYPTILSINEEVDFLTNFSPDVIVFGLCAYFSLTHGMFDEFDKFHEQYISKAESLKNLRNFTLPTRRWEWEIKKLLK